MAAGVVSPSSNGRQTRLEGSKGPVADIMSQPRRMHHLPESFLLRVDELIDWVPNSGIGLF